MKNRLNLTVLVYELIQGATVTVSSINRIAGLLNKFACLNSEYTLEVFANRPDLVINPMNSAEFLISLAVGNQQSPIDYSSLQG
jgi:hypothetical protein